MLTQWPFTPGTRRMEVQTFNLSIKIHSLSSDPSSPLTLESITVQLRTNWGGHLNTSLLMWHVSETKINNVCWVFTEFHDVMCMLLQYNLNTSPPDASGLPSVSVSPCAEIVDGRKLNMTCSSDANLNFNSTMNINIIRLTLMPLVPIPLLLFRLWLRWIYTH